MKINERRLRFVLTSQTGPIGRFLDIQGKKVVSAAKVLATEEGLVREGQFRASLASQVKNEGPSLVLDVGSRVKHFRYLELGTEPHLITPASKKALWWEEKPNQRPEWVLLERPRGFVRHPGNRAYRIVGRSIEKVMANRIQLLPG